MVIDSMSTLTVEQPNQKPPRPSYSPTPHSLNIHGSDFSIRRRRRISGDWSPAPATTTPAPPTALAAPGSISHDTPMIKKAAYWGSQPNGRDWGSTVRAEKEDIDRISRWLDGSDAVYRASGEFIWKANDDPCGAPGLLVRSNTLTFDGEEDDDGVHTSKAKKVLIENMGVEKEEEEEEVRVCEERKTRQGARREATKRREHAPATRFARR